MIKIENVKGRQILDSRGNPTVEVDIVLSNGLVGSASVPSGASTGKYEAVELRDGSKSYDGKSVTKAIDNIDNDIKNIILGRSPLEQTKIDNDLISLDGTSNKNKLGANAILSDLQGAPAFICLIPRPTARSAIIVSSVSPDLWEIIGS